MTEEISPPPSAIRNERQTRSIRISDGPSQRKAASSLGRRAQFPRQISYPLVRRNNIVLHFTFIQPRIMGLASKIDAEQNAQKKLCSGGAESRLLRLAATKRA